MAENTTPRKKKSLNLTGSSDKVYDLDNMERTASDQALMIHVHKYSKKAGESSNPDNLKIGQIWISQNID